MIEVFFMFELPEVKARQFRDRLAMVVPMSPPEKDELKALLLSMENNPSSERIKELIGRAVFIDQKSEQGRPN
jgi:hypothetical protein